VEAVPALLIRIVRMDSSTTVVAVAGEIDLGSAPQLHRHLRVLPDRDTVLDMSGVSRLLAAAGLTALLDTQDRLTRLEPDWCSPPSRRRCVDPWRSPGSTRDWRRRRPSTPGIELITSSLQAG
jgi:hypothetical protein